MMEEKQSIAFHKVIEEANAILEAGIIEDVLRFRLTVTESGNVTYGEIRSLNEHQKLQENFHTLEQVFEHIKNPKNVQFTLSDRSVTLRTFLGKNIIDFAKINLIKTQDDKSAHSELENVGKKNQTKDRISNVKINENQERLAKQTIQETFDNSKKKTDGISKDKSQILLSKKSNTLTYEAKVDEKISLIQNQHSNQVRQLSNQINLLRKQIEDRDQLNLRYVQDIKNLQLSVEIGKSQIIKTKSKLQNMIKFVCFTLLLILLCFWFVAMGQESEKKGKIEHDNFDKERETTNLLLNVQQFKREQEDASQKLYHQINLLRKQVEQKNMETKESLVSSFKKQQEDSQKLSSQINLLRKQVQNPKTKNMNSELEDQNLMQSLKTETKDVTEKLSQQINLIKNEFDNIDNQIAEMPSLKNETQTAKQQNISQQYDLDYYFKILLFVLILLTLLILFAFCCSKQINIKNWLKVNLFNYQKNFNEFFFHRKTLRKVSHGWFNFVFFEKILFEKEFRFNIKIVESQKRYIQIGVLDYDKEKQNKFTKYDSQNAVFYSASNGSKFPDRVIEGSGVDVGETVEVIVNRKTKTIKWMVDGQQRAASTNQMLADKQRQLFPFVMMCNLRDTIEFVKM